MFAEPASPEYFLDSFPREGFPRYQWTERPAGLPAQAWTTETTHRDGQQGGLPLTTAHSLRIYDLMCAFTGTSGAIRQAEFFVYRPSDRAALESALERWRGGAPIEPTTWIRALRKDVELIRGDPLGGVGGRRRHRQQGVEDGEGLGRGHVEGGVEAVPADPHRRRRRQYGLHWQAHPRARALRRSL